MKTILIIMGILLSAVISNAQADTPERSQSTWILAAMSIDDGHLSDQPLATLDDCRSVTAAHQGAVPSLSILLKPEAAAKIQKFTASHLNQQMALLLNGKVIQKMTIRAAITGDVIMTDPVSPQMARQFEKAFQKEQSKLR